MVLDALRERVQGAADNKDFRHSGKHGNQKESRREIVKRWRELESKKKREKR